MKRIARLLASLAALSAGATSAAPVATVPYVWRNVVIGGGGFSPNVIFSPAEKGLAYLRTDVGGAYRWDNIKQRWIPLEDSIWEDSYYGIESIAPDPKDPNVVYVAGGMYAWQPAAILRSSDRGATWQINKVPFKMGGNEDGRGMGERLAVDPNHTSTLFFGSRHDGLWRSDDSGATWSKVTSFPWAGLGTPQARKTHGGVSFVVFDRSSRGTAGSRIIYAGVADPASHHLFRSVDGGKTWAALAGEPAASLLPVKAAVASDGRLFVDYCTSIGPNDIDDGAVWSFEPRTGAWRDITPARRDNAEGGYMGLSVDARRPGRLAVSTVDRWNHSDTIWLSDDAGAHWTSLLERSSRDTSTAPFLKFGRAEAPFGHWVSGLGIDPFDGGTLAYTTGDSVYRTSDGLKPRLLWTPWVKGVEETVPLSLASPTGGAHLVSGIGDVHGFVHDRLDRPPQHAFLVPDLPNTNNVDFAGRTPSILVRSASPYVATSEGVSLAWSADGGHNWRELVAPAVPTGGDRRTRIDGNGDAPITVSADGKTFVVSGPAMLATADRGISWWRPTGLPDDARAVADKAASQIWYAIDYRGGKLFLSRDRAKSFQRVPATGLPASLWDPRVKSRETPPLLVARSDKAGELWLLSNGHFYRSTNFGRSFTPLISTDPALHDMFFINFGLGKAAPGARVPAVYAFGVNFKQTFGGLYRSTDAGVHWTRINDDAHQWGLRYRVVTGDPRLFGRVYVGTDGRGILYGDPARSKPLR
ncbi:xyloglucan-specific exo-beta-1,4-glucanase [Sphingomonas sp. F9_3S_D5_B_2]